MRELMTYLPEWYEASPEMTAIQRAIQPELQLIWDGRDDLLLQLDPHTATWGLRYWEEAFGLLSDEALPMAHRRARIVGRIRGMGTTTVQRLRSVVETFCPGCDVAIIEHYGKYVVEISLTITDQAVEDTDGLEDTLRLIMPAHLGWGISITVETVGTLLYGVCSEMAGRMDIWPLVPREIESAGAVTYGAVSEMSRRVSVLPLAAREINAPGKAAAAGALTYHSTMEIYPQGGMANG